MSKHIKLVILAICALLTTSNAFAQGRDITYTVNEAEYEGYFIQGGDNSKLILLIHDWDGLTDYEIKRAEMLSELGYSVFAADLFGKGVRPTEVKDRRQHTGELYADRAKMRALINGALETARLEGADTSNAVTFGYCFGGAAVLELARSGADLKGFVTFHGGLSTPEGQNYADTKGEVVVFHGTADGMITMDDFASLAKQLEEAGVAHEMITYGGADHAFSVFGGERYDQNADEQSWARFVKFLNETLD